ncbi:MAG TPA: pyruvate kinase [Thermoplasmata archaeon]|nr:pyruvate kinase [Thermoplasmata archaeon]
MRRTKLLVTIGPASTSTAVVDRLLALGTDAFRINFSHGTDTEHRAALLGLRSAADRVKREVALVADLQGPKIRIGDLRGGSIVLDVGHHWRLDTRPEPGDLLRAPVSLPELTRSVRPGDPLLLGDGVVELVVSSVEAGGVDATVVHGGSVSSHAGLFLPRAQLRAEILGPKDRHDLEVALSGGADFIALSFVRDGADVRSARKRIMAAGRPEVGLIAKIERAEALKNIDGILDAADGIMVARGDLGIEVPLERLALEQKSLVAKANAANTPVIVATQMLLSMVTSPRPTRAEATDVANAVLDGADAVMLSEESAVGRFPVEAVEWLDRICRATEGAIRPRSPAVTGPPSAAGSAEVAVAAAAVRLAEEVGAVAIVTPTHSGRTARLVAASRPSTPVLAISSLGATRRRLALTWGVEAFECPAELPLDALRTFAERLAASRPGARPGAPLVLTAGYPVEGRPTNLVTALEVGRPRGSARPGRGRATGRG